MKIELYPPLSIYEIGQRANQEDAIAQWDNRLFVLCDGMGGHEKGEVASQTVCQSLVKWFEENIKDDTFCDGQLRDALEYAYTELDKYDDDSPKKMGTTLTLLYIHSKGVTAAHIGDSRIYHIRPSKLDEGVLYQSRDHSLVFDLFQAGEISYDDLAIHPQKNIITRAMTPGAENRTRPDIIHITDIHPEDYFYLCSDGMLELMDKDNQLLLALFVSHAPDILKRDQFISETRSNQDNHSAWIIHIKSVTKEVGDESLANEELTARCNVINLIPKTIQDDVVDTEEAELAEGNDVVVVEDAPQQSIRKKGVIIKLILLVIALLAILLAVWHFFADDGNEDQEEEQHSEYLIS